MKVTQELREGILAQLADPESLQIIRSVFDGKKTAMEIGKELNLPSTTLYRKISELKKCRLLLVDNFEFRADGKREARYSCSFTEIILRAGQQEVELEIVPSTRSLEKGWFEMFFSPKQRANRPG